MITIPIPEGLKLPKEPQFDIPITVEVQDGELSVLAIGGMPLPETNEEANAKPEEEPSFTSAVEAAMASGKQKGGQAMM